jgi:hypothetical protein
MTAIAITLYGDWRYVASREADPKTNGKGKLLHWPSGRVNGSKTASPLATAPSALTTKGENGLRQVSLLCELTRTVLPTGLQSAAYLAALCGLNGERASMNIGTVFVCRGTNTATPQGFDP